METTIKQTQEEKKFEECLKNGDDFFKIEIYRLAKEWYKRALETGIKPEVVNARLKDLNKKIASERKTIFILMGIAAVIILSVVIIKAI